MDSWRDRSEIPAPPYSGVAAGHGPGGLSEGYNKLLPFQKVV